MELFKILELDIWLKAYLVLMVADFITGFLKAYKTEGFKSRKMRDGVIRVVGELVAIIVCGVLDVVWGLNGVGLLGCKIMFVGKEAISIAENLKVIGVGLPDEITEHLSVSKRKWEDQEEDQEDE